MPRAFGDCVGSTGKRTAPPCCCCTPDVAAVTAAIIAGASSNFDGLAATVVDALAAYVSVVVPAPEDMVVTKLLLVGVPGGEVGMNDGNVWLASMVAPKSSQ